MSKYVQCTQYMVQCTLGVAQNFRFACTLFEASLHKGEHFPKLPAKNNDRYPTRNAVICLLLNNSTSK